MINKRWNTCLICILLLFFSSIVTPVEAQSNTFSASLRKADINVNMGETTTVMSSYQFRASSATKTPKNLKIKGDISSFPNSNISNISVTVNKQRVKPEVTRQYRIIHLAVPIRNMTTSEDITVKVKYRIEQKGEEKRIPLWVPQYTTKTQNNINMSITLPSGTHPQGDIFPRPKDVSGNHMKSTTEFVPGFIMVGYGQTPGTGLTLDTILSIIGIILVVVLIGVGTVYEYRGRRNGQVEGE